MRMNDPSIREAANVMESLRAGNRRFASNVRSIDALASQARRQALTDGQAPRAIVLSCSDSRVPAEIVFDCGLGDLFVVRVAGAVCAPSLVGSVEFAAETFDTPLVIVMGHSGCGAVKATLRAMRDEGVLSANVLDIVERIRPAVAPLVEAAEGARLAPDALLAAANRANILHTTSQLRHGSALLEERIGAGKLAVVGAEYSLETGEVDFFDVPAAVRAAVAAAA